MSRYATDGRVILRDGTEIMRAATDEMAAQIAESFDAVAAWERLTHADNKPTRHAIVNDLLGSDKLMEVLTHAIADPQHFTPRMPAEPQAVWIARAAVASLGRLS